MLISSRKTCREISSGFTTARGRRSAHIPMMHGENAVCPEPTGIRYWKTRLWPSITPSATVDIIMTTKPDSIISKADTIIRNGDGFSMRMGISMRMVILPGSNNPVMGYDPTGEWDWGKFWDSVVSFGATVAGGAAAIKTGAGIFIATGNVGLAIAGGAAAGTAVTGMVNNAVNAVYYHFSDGISDLEQDLNASSYVTQGYIDRWSRLDYVKSQLGGEYNSNAWRYYSEYNFHMYAWMATGWAYDESGANKSLFSKVAASAYKADIDPYHWDSRAKVNIPTVIIGVFGL